MFFRKYKYYIAFSLIIAVLIGMALNINYKKGDNSKVIIQQDKTYKNFLKLDNEWEDYGIGDPYIFRYNGKYYLYCSTKDFRKGIKAWSSEDLINWKYEGLVTEEEISTGAYAPEVIYWDGYFYMYTSPAGKGHYVLKSENPTGPFKVMTENLGLTIDGSVFIDDDEKWYFTHAGTQGITGHEMKDPYTIEVGKNLAAYLNWWTEGSMIIKRNNNYYMTYTGNHVFSKGYRVDYGISKDGPIGNYSIPKHNTLLISTEKDFNGLGHSSTVMGPDMDSYYIIYHNLVGASKEGPPVRQMNIDRIVFNGDKMSVLGPTNFDVEVPKKADFYTNSLTLDSIQKVNERNIVLADKETEGNFIAEYNFIGNTSGNTKDNSIIGAVFSYKNEKNFGYAEIDIKSNKLNLFSITDGEIKLLGSAQFVTNFDFTKLHTIRLEKYEKNIKVFFDNMLKINNKAEALTGGKIGYIYNEVSPSLQYTAFNNSSNNNSDFDVYKPIPGTIEAVHYMWGKEIGSHAENDGKAANDYRNDNNMELILKEDGSNFVKLEKNEWLNYKVNVKERGLYNLDLTVKKQDDSCKIEVYVDDEKKKSYTVDLRFPKGDAQWVKVNAGDLALEKGFHTLKLKVTKGSLELSSFELNKADKSKIDKSFDLTNGKLEGWTYYGNWLTSDAGSNVLAGFNSKAFTGKKEWSDYELEADISIEEGAALSDSGLMFRVTNESYFKEQVQDSYMGYFLEIANDKIRLNKINYGREGFTREDIALVPGKTHHIKIKAVKSNIKIYFDDMKNPIIDYYDEDAYMFGKIGIASNDEGINFKNVRIRSVD